jgi:hypothetical protein
MAKVIGVQQLLAKKYRLVEGLTPEMKDSLGDIEDAFTAIVYGRSGHGKTNFTIKVIKELTHALDARAIYNSLEEGHGKTIQDLAIRHNLQEHGNYIKFVDNEPFVEFLKRLQKKNSPKIGVIDSVQYMNLTFDEYKQLKEGCRKKILLFISHEEGGKPKGSVAKAIQYDANIKIRVEGFIAFVTSRYGGNKNYVIAEDRAKNFWGSKAFKKHLTR